jgi:hypothetical protein
MVQVLLKITGYDAFSPPTGPFDKYLKVVEEIGSDCFNVCYTTVFLQSLIKQLN